MERDFIRADSEPDATPKLDTPEAGKDPSPESTSATPKFDDGSRTILGPSGKPLIRTMATRGKTRTSSDPYATNLPSDFNARKSGGANNWVTHDGGTYVTDAEGNRTNVQLGQAAMKAGKADTGTGTVVDQATTNPVSDKDRMPVETGTGPEQENTGPFDPDDTGTGQPPPPDDGDPALPPIETGGGGVPDFIPDEQDSDAPVDPDMDASVDDAGDVGFPEGDHTVAGNLETLYDRDSPFFEKARQQAMRRHLGAGGQNSAMAAAAGELAAMDTAFRVAFEDAKTNANFKLADQAYKQARELQSQRIEAQFEAIRLDFKGRSFLMDKELDQWFMKARQQHQYALDLMWEQESAFEGREQRGFQRKMTLEGMMAMSEFMTSSVASVIAATANLKNAEQQRASMQSGMAFLSQQFDYLQSFWGQWAAGGPSQDEANWLGQSGGEAGTWWWDWSGGGSQPELKMN